MLLEVLTLLSFVSRPALCAALLATLGYLSDYIRGSRALSERLHPQFGNCARAEIEFFHAEPRGKINQTRFLQTGDQFEFITRDIFETQVLTFSVKGCQRERRAK